MPDQRRALVLPHGDITLPAFLPDATRAAVRAADASDLEACGTQAVVMNTFHLMQRPGSSTVRALGGLHRMSGWHRPIITDSGGFQAYSLIRQNPKYGKLSHRGLTFEPDGAPRPFVLTPEKSIQLQMAYGSDVLFCLDDCTHPDDPIGEQEESVRRTTAWALRCKREYQRLVEQKRLEPQQRPLLFAVIQGGRSHELRKACADQLLEIGFDGYGYGGWPLDRQGKLLSELLAYTRELVPETYPLHALGVGHPESIVDCVRMGYSMFDSALPTRDARRGRLYTGSASLTGQPFKMLYIGDIKHIKSARPITEDCDCLCCTRYTLGYLHHLYTIKETLYLRLATVHNLRYVNRLLASNL